MSDQNMDEKMFKAEDMKEIDNLFNKHEEMLSHLYEWEKKNIELEKQIQVDSIRVNSLRLEGEAKSKERDRSTKKLEDLREVYSKLSEYLDQIEEILDNDSLSEAQMDELSQNLTSAQEILHQQAQSSKKRKPPIFLSVL